MTLAASGPYAIAACLLLQACAHQPAARDDGEAFTPLLTEATLGTWRRLGQSNWRAADGAIIADASSGPAPGYLVSQNTYKDFMLRVEFWASADANSGVFLRCADPGKITDTTCYEANIFDQRPDPTYGTGAIVRHAEVSPMPKAGGQWNTYIITAKGRDITVVLNGKTTAKLRSGLLEDGYIAVQHGGGEVRFRMVEVRGF